jgi:hypothetical protein
MFVFNTAFNELMYLCIRINHHFKMKPTSNFVEQLSPHLFWDTDPNQIDPVIHRAFLIGRILSHGLLSDWLLLKATIDRETIRSTVLELRYMDKYSLHFCMAYFNEPIQNFRCYNYEQLNPAHWNY